MSATKQRSDALDAYRETYGFDRLLDIVRRNPGLDAGGLKAKGWWPRSHGSLRDAETLALIEFRDGGWYVVEGEPPC